MTPRPSFARELLRWYGVYRRFSPPWRALRRAWRLTTTR